MRSYTFSPLYDQLSEMPEFEDLKRSSLRKFVTSNFSEELSEIREGNGSVQSLAHRAISMRKDYLCGRKKKAKRAIITCPLLPSRIIIEMDSLCGDSSVTILENLVRKLRMTKITYE